MVATAWLNDVCTRESALHSSGQRVDVRALQLGELAPLEDQLDDRVLTTKRLERVGVGAASGLGLATACEAEIVVEESRQLLRAARVERVARGVLHLALDLGDARVHLRADRAEEIAVHRDALNLHRCENGHERELHLVMQAASRWRAPCP